MTLPERKRTSKQARSASAPSSGDEQDSAPDAFEKMNNRPLTLLPASSQSSSIRSSRKTIASRRSSKKQSTADGGIHRRRRKP